MTDSIAHACPHVSPVLHLFSLFSHTVVFHLHFLYIVGFFISVSALVPPASPLFALSVGFHLLRITLSHSHLAALVVSGSVPALLLLEAAGHYCSLQAEPEVSGVTGYTNTAVIERWGTREQRSRMSYAVLVERRLKINHSGLRDSS